MNNPDPNDLNLCPKCLKRWLAIEKRKREMVA